MFDRIQGCAGAAFFLQEGRGGAGGQEKKLSGEGGAGQEQKFVGWGRVKQCVNRKFMGQKITKINFPKGLVTYYGIWVPTLPPDRTQPQKLCTANFSSRTFKTLINRLLRLKIKIS